MYSIPYNKENFNKLKHVVKERGFIIYKKKFCKLNLNADRIANLKKIKDVINNFLEIKKAIQLCTEYSPTCTNFWMCDYSTSRVDRFGQFRCKYLKDYIDTYKICFIAW